MSNEISLVVLRTDSMAVTRASVMPLEQMHVFPIMKVNSSVWDSNSSATGEELEFTDGDIDSIVEDGSTDGEILVLGDADGLGDTDVLNTSMNVNDSSPVMAWTEVMISAELISIGSLLEFCTRASPQDSLPLII